MGTITLTGKARPVQLAICRVAAYLNNPLHLTPAAIASGAGELWVGPQMKIKE